MLIQIGGLVIVLFGQVRSDSWTGGKARYLAAGFCNIMVYSWNLVRKSGKARAAAGASCGVGLPGGHGALDQATGR
ncbi:hypothetical protein GCM10011572_25380 [Pseudoduganella buxea]|uniref:Uncharacterized protein n=1 Tax=Pseudoduganella buxea TaxID=1949069 RepID=A0ABQ1KP00_9BURK|nr:hypothetical protein GCM10011572_25380 [Pseudoduganella buxea]